MNHPLGKLLAIIILIFCNVFFVYSQADEQYRQDIQELQQKIRKSTSSKQKGRWYFDIGRIYEKNERYRLSLLYADSSIALAESSGHDSLLAAAMVLKGNGLSLTEENDASATAYLRAIEIRKKLGDIRGEGIARANLGSLYNYMKDTVNAIRYLKSSIQLLLKTDSLSDVAFSYMEIGNYYITRGVKDSADYYYDVAYKMLPDIKDLTIHVSAYGNKAMMAEKYNDTQKAIAFYDTAIAIASKLQDMYSLTKMLNNLSVLYLNNKQYDMAIQIATRSEQLSEEHEILVSLKFAYGNLAGMHGEAGNYKEAFHYMRNYSGLTLHMYNIEAQRTREELETQMRLKENRFELEKTQKENEKKDAEIRAGNAALQNIRMQKALLFGGLGLVALFGLFMLNRYRVIRKQRQEIEKKNTETEYQKHLVEEKNKEILDSIHYAKRIQAAILPPARIVKEYLPESFILYKPKDIVAGDFYWMESPPKGESEGTVLFAAADCTGHGVPGAMVSVVCNNGLNRSVREHGLTDPGKILDKTRDIVIAEFEKSDEDVKDGMDISLVALTHIGTDSHLSLQWAGANNPLWIIRNGEVLETKADKQPIGKYSDPKPFTTHTIDLQKGDAIYIFTDGFQDQFGGEKGKKFKAANLKQLLLTLQHETMDRQRELLADAFENWRAGYEQIDDVCVIGVRL
jgi:serine phosphatase RsbU (regulator of sigma subunit)